MHEMISLKPAELHLLWNSKYIFYREKPGRSIKTLVANIWCGCVLIYSWVRCVHGFIENVRCGSSFDMPDKHVGAPSRYCKFPGQELRRQRGIAKSANIPKFSHHPPSYLPSLRLFPRLLTPAGDFCSQREVFLVYITLPSSRQPTLLGLHPPKTLVHARSRDLEPEKQVE